MASSSSVRVSSPQNDPPSLLGNRKLLERVLHSVLGNWGWEIGGLLVSLVSSALTLAILLSMDEKPLRNWAIAIQPNSLIAVFSAIGKSGLLVPLSGCIGQLKWMYFQSSKPHPLSRMGDFDEASRGPWGSLTFLLKVQLWTSTWIASFGAATVVLCLAYEPFTQQMLQLYPKTAHLANMTGIVSSSTSFSDKNLLTNADLQGVEHPLIIGVIDHIAQRPINLLDNYYCPTTTCRLKEFTSLGLCSSCTTRSVKFDDHFWFGNATDSDFKGCDNTAMSTSNITSADNSFASDYTAWKAFVTKQEPYSFGRLCTVKHPGFPDLLVNIKVDREKNGTFPSIGITDMQQNPQGYQTGIIKLLLSKTNKRYRIYDASRGNLMWEIKVAPELPSVYYCVGNHDRLVDPIISTMNIPMPGLSVWSCFQSTSNLTRVVESDQLGFVNGTVSHCALDYCVKKYHDISFRNNRVTYGSVSQSPLRSEGSNIEVPHRGWDFRFRLDRNGSTDDQEYIIGNHSRLFFASAMQRVMESTTISTFMPPYFEANLTWPDFFHGVAEVGSKVLQGPGNAAATNFTTDSFGQEIYVKVRWAWVALPLALILFTTAILVLTAHKSSKRSYTYKNNVLAVLLHGVEGLKEQDYRGLGKGEKESSRDLGQMTKRLETCFEKDDNGILKLRLKRDSSENFNVRAEVKRK